jgi:hydroxylamine dehydrogenase
MAPDYTWWHGFYECKKRYANFMKEADDLLKHNQKAYTAPLFPGSGGNPRKPPEIFGKTE